jgi:hypothetical protein
MIKKQFKQSGSVVIGFLGMIQVTSSGMTPAEISESRALPPPLYYGNSYSSRARSLGVQTKASSPSPSRQ